MVFTPHRRLTYSGIFGTLLGPVEEWSFRLNLGFQEGGGDPVTLVGLFRDAYVTHMKQRIKPVAVLTEVKLADIGPDGRYTSEPTVLGVEIPGEGTSSVNYPLSTTLAISLTTGRRGPSGRGRIFLPAPSLGALTTTGLLPAASAQAFAIGCADFFGAINQPAGFGNIVVVSSKGFDTVVTGVRVGQVPDVMRSRREKQLEAYGATLVVPS